MTARQTLYGLLGAATLAVALGCGNLLGPQIPPPEVIVPELAEPLPSVEPIRNITPWAVPQLDCPQGQSTSRTTEAGLVEVWCVKGDEMHGPTRQWYGKDQPAMEGQYVNDKRDGNWTWRHPNQQESAKGSYKAGKQAGSWTWWYENGQPAETGDFLNDMRAGTWTTFHPNGVKASEGSYVNGKKEGDWVAWDEDGSEIERTRWRMGVKSKR